MQIPQRLAVQLAKAYALTEILPLRHSSVQAALDELTRSVGEEGLRLELKDQEIWVEETKVEDGEEVLDLSRGLSRCGVVSVVVGPALESRVLGTFLDTVRIASISGHLDNLQEMVAFHGSNLQVEFGAPTEEVPELSQPAGAIFAGALSGAEVVGARVETPAVEGGGTREPTVQRRADSRTDQPSGSVDGGDPSHGREWDPPGTEPRGIDAEGGGTTPAVESPLENAMTPAEFSKGVGFFMRGTPEQRLGWAGPLAEQAARVDGASDPGATLDVVIDLLGQPGHGAEDAVTEVASRLVRPVVAKELALRLGKATDEDERGMLLQVAGQLGAVVAPAFAEELATSDDRAARRGLVHALTFLGEAALETVDALLDRDEWYVVRNAVTVLGAVGGPDAFVRLEPCLTHPDSRVRRETVMALTQLESANAGRLLTEALADEESDVRAAATMVAGILKVRETAPVLRSRIDAEENEGVVIETIRTLGKLKDVEAVGLLKRRAVPSFFSRPPKPVRIAAYRALSRIRTPEAVQVLRDSEADRDPEIRTLIHDALDGMG